MVRLVPPGFVRKKSRRAHKPQVDCGGGVSNEALTSSSVTGEGTRKSGTRFSDLKQGFEAPHNLADGQI